VTLLVDARPAAHPEPAGIGRTVRGLADVLVARARGRRVRLLTDRPLPSPPPGAEVLRGPRGPAWHAWALSQRLRRRDAVHVSLGSLIVPAMRPGGSVLLVPDLAPLRTPRAHDFRTRTIHRLALSRCVRRASALLVYSDHVREEVTRLWDVDPARIATAPPAAAAPFDRADPPGDGDARRARLGVAAPYVLAVATRVPRKNLATLVRAVALLRSVHGSAHGLVVAGGAGWGDPSIDAALSETGLGAHVRFPGFVADADLHALYCGADALACVSLDEGFGLPVLEAMSVGTPVVAARAGALPEVGGSAVVYADPRDPAEIALRLAEVLSDACLAARLRSEGRARARTFSWDRFADAVVAAAERASS